MSTLSLTRYFLSNLFVFDCSARRMVLSVQPSATLALVILENSCRLFPSRSVIRIGLVFTAHLSHDSALSYPPLLPLSHC